MIVSGQLCPIDDPVSLFLAVAGCLKNRHIIGASLFLNTGSDNSIKIPPSYFLIVLAFFLISPVSIFVETDDTFRQRAQKAKRGKVRD